MTSRRTKTMKEFNIIIKPLITEWCFRVKANNKKEAISKVLTLGFNCGETLATFSKGDFIISSIDDVTTSLRKEINHLYKGARQ